MTDVKADGAAVVGLAAVDEQVQQLADRARAEGLQLAGEGAKYWLRVLTEIKNRGAASWSVTC